MRMHFLHTTMRVAAVGLLAPFFLGGVTIKECPRGKPTHASYTWDFPAEADRLFDQFELHNQSLIMASDRLLNMSQGPSKLSWQTHATLLTKARKHVNEMNEILCRLERIKPAVEPWQAKLIDRIHEDAVLAATHVEAAIEYLNSNKDRIEDAGVPVYHQQIEAINTGARDLESRLAS